VKGGRIVLGQAIALALHRLHVHHYRSPQGFHVAQHLFELDLVVAIQWADVFKAEVDEEVILENDALETALNPAKGGDEPLAAKRNVADQSLDAYLKPAIPSAHGQFAQILGKRSRVRADRHFIVVQYHDQVIFALSGAGQGLKGHASGQGAVADYGDDFSGVTLQTPGGKQTEGGRN